MLQIQQILAKAIYIAMLQTREMCQNLIKAADVPAGISQ
jgi:hypothetical protein